MRRTLIACVVVLAVAATARAQEAGRQYALLVGVQDYSGTQLTNLRHADNDVAALAEVLRTKGNYRLVTLLTVSAAFKAEKLDHLPTAANVRTHLRALLADRRPEDTVLVAFAGHGVVLKGTNELYFCPQGADLTRPKETLVALGEVYAALRGCKAGVRMLIVDACRNEASATRAGRPSLELESETRPELPKPPEGVAALFSCSAGEVAFESRRHPHGLFFHHLLEGLNGKAANRRGQVLLESLVGYVKGEMADTLLEEFGPNARQRPHLLGDLAGAVAVVGPRTDRAPAAVEVHSADDLVRRGRSHFLKNDYDRAIADFSEAIRLDPKSVEARIERGDVYRLYTRDYARAVADYTEAIRLDANTAETYRRRGWAYRFLNNHEAALADCTTALRLDPNSARAYADRGDIHGLLNRHAEAVADYTAALRLDPKSPRIYPDRGNVYREMGKFDEALADYTEAIRLDPKSARAYRGRAYTYQDKREYPKAIADYTEAIRLQPNDAGAYASRGHCAYMSNNYDASIADYTDAIRLQPTNKYYHEGRGYSYRGKKEFAKAVVDFTEVIRLDPARADAYHKRGLSYQAVGDAVRAAEDLAKYKQMTGKDP